MYHALIHRQIIKLFNDITQIKTGNRILLKIRPEFEKRKILHFLASNEFLIS